VKENNSWCKSTLSGIIKSNELSMKFPEIYKKVDSDKLEHLFSNDYSPLKQSIIYEIERKLFPLKFSDLELPCYIIPIKPYWASQLFDKISANHQIFGAPALKIWNRENVYYRSIKPVSEKVPARILCYSSSQKGFVRQNSIIATSYLDSVTIDKVKVQYSKYKKYGIYDWKDIYNLAKNDIENDVKALIFSETEVFKEAIPFKRITEILLLNGFKKNTFASPLEVNFKVFNDFYKLVNN
jgi:hypothetical protein